MKEFYLFYKRILALLLFIILISCSDDNNNITKPYVPSQLSNSTWELIANPDAVGWSSKKLNEAYQYSLNIETAAVMIIYNGKVLYHWGEIDRKFCIHSCRKSLLSALYGIHVKEGNIDLSLTMGDLGIDDNPPSLSELEKTATIKMLLQARSGIYHEAAAEASSMKEARPERYSHAPGTFWYYNNWDFNVLGTIFEQETNKKIFEEFKVQIADQIGMEDFKVSDGSYVYEDLSLHPAYPFRITARDMARFGLLFLQNGIWNGKQIISKEWIKESTTSYSDAGMSGGYGYMWWVAVDGNLLPGLKLEDGPYAASGYNGHFILVIPNYDLVIVHRVNTDINNRVSSLQFAMLVGMILDARTI